MSPCRVDGLVDHAQSEKAHRIYNKLRYGRHGTMSDLENGAAWDSVRCSESLCVVGLGQGVKYSLGHRWLVANTALYIKGGAQVVWIRALRTTCCSQFDSNIHS